MSLEDKVALCSGASFWQTKKFEKYGIPSMFMCDGPHGLRKQEGTTDMLGVNNSRPATCFPAEVTTAGSWNPELTEAIGRAIGEEARKQGVGLVLGPGANIKRSPLCGRIFEYFSEDPYLAGKLAAGFIRGAESQGIGTSLKHFADNSQELDRLTSDSILDERTLRELYLTAFEIAVKEGKPSTVMCAYVKSAASNANTVIVFAGLPSRCESEGFDRNDIKMPEGHIRMIEAAAKANPNTVVVLLCGSAVECPWSDSVKGILYMGLPGEAGGEAIADLLYGRAYPCGRLAESWPMSYADIPTSEIYGKTTDALYEEGMYVGYRYYEKAGVPVRWAFGFGLSYTKFAYSGLKVSGNSVKATVKNTGKCAGAEVVQLYIAAPQDGVHRPLRELKGFRKVFLEPDEKRTVTFELSERSFAVWQDGWKVPAGHYTVSVGGLTADIEKSGDCLSVAAWQAGSWYEHCSGKPNRKDWEAALGCTYTPSEAKKGSFTTENTVMEMKDQSLLMNMMYKAIEKTVVNGFDGKADYNDPDFRMMMNSSAGAPIRSMQISGGIKGGLMPGMVEIANGRFFRGIWKIITG